MNDDVKAEFVKCPACGRRFWREVYSSDSEVAFTAQNLCNECSGTPIAKRLTVSNPLTPVSWSQLKRQQRNQQRKEQALGTWNPEPGERKALLQRDSIQALTKKEKKELDKKLNDFFKCVERRKKRGNRGK